jgi:hypothetical protein
MPHPEYDRPQPDYQVFLATYAQVWERWHRSPTPRNAALLVAGEQLLNHELSKPGRFELGQTVATPGVVQAMQEAGHIPPEFLLRHKHGDWGDLDPEDKCVNEEALRRGQRLLSAYHTRRSDKLWVITEWDRSVTTLLLPDEY